MPDATLFETDKDSLLTIEHLRQIELAKARRGPLRPPDGFPLHLLQRADKSDEAPAERIKASLGAPGVTAGLEPFTGEMTENRARHLLRRVSFGPNTSSLGAIVGRPVGEVVDGFIDGVFTRELPPEPWWTSELPPHWTAPESEQLAYNEAVNSWNDEVRNDTIARFVDGHFQERLMLFWHNHFVTEGEKYYHATYRRRYADTLRSHALGDFREFVRAIGMTEAMLIYLDLALNNRYSPNDNYARELLELFTMGIVDQDGNPNYTEGDISEIARALTGYEVYWHTLSEVFNPDLYDGTGKTIFGRTAPFDYDGVVDLLFEERGTQIAWFICRKIYREFVHPVADETIVRELADLFVQSDFELAPVFRTLMKSAHFWDEGLQGTRIKAPLELFVQFTRAMDATSIGPEAAGFIHWFAGTLGQFIYDPVNVAGWPGHEAWISTSTLPERWLTNGWQMGLMTEFRDENPADGYEGSLTGLARSLVGPEAQYTTLEIPIALARHLLNVPIEDLDVPAVANEFGGDLRNNPLPDFVASGHPNEINLIKTFLGGIPWYEWSLELDWAKWTLYEYVTFLGELPEYQLA